MKAPLLLAPLIGLLAAACKSGPAPDNSVSAVQAKEYLDRIRPGMTLGEVRRTVPHVSERALMLNHGGLDYCLELSHDYQIGLRVSHSDKRGPSEQEQRLILMPKEQLLDYYDHNLINAPPFLEDRKGRIISTGYQPW